MKTISFNSKRGRHSQRGSAVLILLAFLTLMLIFVAATTRTIMMTKKELKLIEKHQVARLTATTHLTPAAAKPAGSP